MPCQHAGSHAPARSLLTSEAEKGFHGTSGYVSPVHPLVRFDRRGEEFRQDLIAVSNLNLISLYFSGDESEM